MPLGGSESKAALASVSKTFFSSPTLFIKQLLGTHVRYCTHHTPHHMYVNFCLWAFISSWCAVTPDSKNTSHANHCSSALDAEVELSMLTQT